MTLSELYTLFQTPSQSPANNKKPFAFEPFAMPVRAIEADVQGQAQAIQALREMEAVGAVPEFVSEKSSAQSLSGLVIDTAKYAEAGASFSQQVAAFLCHLYEEAPAPGTDVLTVHWLVGLEPDLAASCAAIRAGPALAARLLKVRGNEVFILRNHACANPATLVEADAYSNLLRLTSIALAAHLTGCYTIHLPVFSAEATDQHKTITESIHKVIAHEARLTEHGLVLEGSYWHDLLAIRMMESAWELFAQIQKAGGLNSHSGMAIFNELVQDSLHRRLDAAQSGAYVWVGQTKFTNPDLTIAGPIGRKFYQ